MSFTYNDQFIIVLAAEFFLFYFHDGIKIMKVEALSRNLLGEEIGDTKNFVSIYV